MHTHTEYTVYIFPYINSTYIHTYYIILYSQIGNVYCSYSHIYSMYTYLLNSQFDAPRLCMDCESQSSPVKEKEVSLFSL